LRNVTNMPLPEDRVFEAVSELMQDLSRMHAILSDPQVSSVRLVFNPDKMVIKEAQRTLTYVTLYGFPIDAVICNRMIPDEVNDPYFDDWKRSQAENLELVQQAFSPIPLFKVPMFSQEVVGIDMLRRTAAAAFGDLDPAQVFHVGQLYDVSKSEGLYRLSLSLPLASREDIDLTRKREELVVKVGGHKHNVLLPDTLARLPVQSAKYEGDSLVVTFGERSPVG